MIKIVLMDCDGPIIKRKKYFSQRLKELGIALDEKKIDDFFKYEFKEIEVGKGDLKEYLETGAAEWGWKKSIDELLDFWFSGESEVNEETIKFIQNLRSKSVKVFLSTNNEKYRTEYLWNKVGLKNHFDGLFSSCNLGFLKPDLGFWQKVYESLSKHSKDEILVLDDEQESIDAAKQFGFQVEYFLDFNQFLQIMREKYDL